MDDLISREETLTAFADYVGSGMSMNDYDALWDIVANMPSVNPQASKEDIHREREQAYMKGYEDANKRYRTEPCWDVISRQATINAVKRIHPVDTDYDCTLYDKVDVMYVLDEMPSVIPQEPSWIPVSEKLPEDGIYLVTVERTTGKPRVEVMSFAKDLNKVDDYDFPEHKCGWYEYDSEYGYWEDTDVIAWMPLPQPYKGESEDKE